ncbi:hypothetical protein P4B35_22175 [Pontiellaceae bacterium B12227]|nr:hypothetical protein [Pontiellaceae bacterium B12227]
MKSVTDQLCYDIFSSVRTRDGHAPGLLTEEEKALLVESLPTGEFIVFESDSSAPHLATTGRHWWCQKDGSHQEEMLHAFKSLCKRGYIRHMTHCVFRLSGSGIQAARNHASSARTNCRSVRKPIADRTMFISLL